MRQGGRGLGHRECRGAASKSPGLWRGIYIHAGPEIARLSRTKTFPLHAVAFSLLAIAPWAVRDLSHRARRTAGRRPRGNTAISAPASCSGRLNVGRPPRRTLPEIYFASGAGWPAMRWHGGWGALTLKKSLQASRCLSGLRAKLGRWRSRCAHPYARRPAPRRAVRE